MKSYNLVSTVLKRAAVLTGSLLLSISGLNAAMPIGHYQVPVGEGGAEILSFDPSTNIIAVSNAEDNTVELLDISTPSTPVLLVSVAIPGGGVNSVSCFNGFCAVAAEGLSKQDSGTIQIIDLTTKTIVKSYPAGALPDMVTFSPDGNYIVAANEGEPDDDFENDPEGSVTVIDVSSSVLTGVVKQISLASFNDKKQQLRNAGVKLFAPRIVDGIVTGEATVAQDLEPEYVAVTPDSKKAFVGCQENNAVLVINLETCEVEEIQPLGLKDWSKDQPVIINCPFPKMPVIGRTPANQKIRLGGFSGLLFEKRLPNGKLIFLTHPDRGPNGDPTDVHGDGNKERPFPIPSFQPSIYRFSLNPANGKIRLLNRIRLWRRGKTISFFGFKFRIIKKMTGLPNLQADEPGKAYTDEIPVDLLGNQITNDPFGADLEGLAVDEAGNFWMCDEYRPSIYKFNKFGILIKRFIPAGTSAAAGKPAGFYGEESLPAVYASRRANRGFEALAIQDGKVFAFMQSPLDNPDISNIEAELAGKKNDYNSRASKLIRIVEMDLETETITGEYAYLFEGASGVDKIGDAAPLGNGRFAVIERDSSVESDARKFIFEIDLKGATNLLHLDDSIRGINGSLELMGAEQMAVEGIKPVYKRKILNLSSLGYNAGDKPEGLTVLDDNTWAVINDNDFGLLDQPVPYDGSVPLNPDPTKTVLGIISFQQSNQLDPSNEDGPEDLNDPGEFLGAINFRYANVFGMYQPDSMSAVTIDGKTYYLTANEGDARDYDGYSEEERVKDLLLDESFPTDTQDGDQLGRMKTTTELLDLDGDEDIDRIHVYGARSLTIRDENGGIVYDSADIVGKKTAELVPDLFNSDDNSTGKFDQRSDDKGAEPEALTVGKVNGKTYAFLGLERTGGIMIFNISDPKNTTYVNYIRDDLERDISPEGLVFIPASKSPSGTALLGVSNEVSGTVSIYEINDTVLNP